MAVHQQKTNRSAAHSPRSTRPKSASGITSGIGRPCATGAEPNDEPKIICLFRDKEEIKAAHDEVWDKVWYYRCKVRESRGEFNEISQPGMRKREKQYGIENLGPWSDFDWGYMQGKLSALSWVMGSEWDFIDA